MADLGEAFNTLKHHKKTFQNTDFFFTQRTLTEEQEYINKNMNRVKKKVKITHNFLALNNPSINIDGTLIGYDIKIYGDDGYKYEGSIPSFEGEMPNFMIMIKGDKKIFVNVIYKYKESNGNTFTKDFVNFIEVPKRFQLDNKVTDDDTDSQLGN